MRFTKPFWSGIEQGSITLAFRRWTRPTVVPGRPYRTGGGRIEVLSVEEVELDSITAQQAREAGHESLDELLSFLGEDDHGERTLYRIRFKVLNEPDPRELLANDADLDPTSIAGITARLDRLDRAATVPWTRQTLALIDQHPERRAPDLAEMVGREAKPFKLDVRKLKNLGLTESLRVGYRLSPRGRAYVEASGQESR